MFMRRSQSLFYPSRIILSDGTSFGRRSRQHCCRQNNPPSSSRTRMLRSLALFIIYFAAVTGCSSARRPADQAMTASSVPPLPQALHGRLLEWYPDASKRAHECSNRTVIQARMGHQILVLAALSALTKIPENNPSWLKNP